MMIAIMMMMMMMMAIMMRLMVMVIMKVMLLVMKKMVLMLMTIITTSYERWLDLRLSPSCSLHHLSKSSSGFPKLLLAPVVKDTLRCKE